MLDDKRSAIHRDVDFILDYSARFKPLVLAVTTTIRKTAQYIRHRVQKPKKPK